MRLRYWIGDALSGDVLGEVRAAGRGSLVSRLGGGTCTLNVSLSHLKTRDGKSMDVDAVVHTLGLLTGGRRTLIATDHLKRVVGGTEWLLMKEPRSTSSGSVRVQGMEWDGYPALRSLNANYIQSGDQLALAKVLLDAAFLSFNSGMQITIPPATSGVIRSIDYKSHSAYYEDVLDEISSPDDGFEWKVEVTPTWDGDRLTTVTRAVVFGQPTLSRASDVVFHRAADGSRRGNALDISGGFDFSRYAQSVYGIGAGSGDKQRWVGLSDPALTNAGYLNSTKNVSFPGVTDMGVLTALTQAALSAAQDLRDPFEATGWIDKLADLPRVGTSVQLKADAVWAYPTGLDETVRVGEVAFSPNGHQCSTVTVRAI